MQSARSVAEISAGRIAGLTSSQNSGQRLRRWASKSFLLSTPRLLRNDLLAGICCCDNIVLLIIDKVHRTTEDQLYYEIVQLLKDNRRLDHVRIIAQSPTLGSTVSVVQRLVSSLVISRIALRTIKSPDVAPYVHFKEVEHVIVPESSSIKFVRNQFEKHLLQQYINRIHDLGHIEGVELNSLSHSRLLELDRQGHTSERGKHVKTSAAEGALSSLVLLYHAYELLISYGLIPFRAFFKKISTETGSTVQSRLHNELNNIPASHQLLVYIDKLRESSLFLGHPKIDIAEERLGELAIKKPGALMIVISRCRDSVLELASRLAQSSPLFRVMSFVPQSSRTSPTTQKISQKQQTEV